MAGIERSQPQPLPELPAHVSKKSTKSVDGLQPGAKLPPKLPQTPPGGPRVSPGAVSPIPESELPKKGIMGLQAAKQLPETPPSIKPSAEQLRAPLPLTPFDKAVVEEVLDFAGSYVETSSFAGRNALAARLPEMLQLVADSPRAKAEILRSLEGTKQEIENERKELGAPHDRLVDETQDEARSDAMIALETVNFLLNEIRGA